MHVAEEDRVRLARPEKLVSPASSVLFDRTAPSVMDETTKDDDTTRQADLSCPSFPCPTPPPTGDASRGADGSRV